MWMFSLDKKKKINRETFYGTWPKIGFFAHIFANIDFSEKSIDTKNVQNQILCK